jgi:hypothetical protein
MAHPTDAMGYFGKSFVWSAHSFPVAFVFRLSVSLVIPLFGMSKWVAGEETGGKGGVC